MYAEKALKFTQTHKHTQRQYTLNSPSWIKHSMQISANAWETLPKYATCVSSVHCALCTFYCCIFQMKHLQWNEPTRIKIAPTNQPTQNSADDIMGSLARRIIIHFLVQWKWRKKAQWNISRHVLSSFCIQIFFSLFRLFLKSILRNIARL